MSVSSPLQLILNFLFHVYFFCFLSFLASLQHIPFARLFVLSSLTFSTLLHKSQLPLSVYLFFILCPFPLLSSKFPTPICPFIWSSFCVIFLSSATNSQIPFPRLFVFFFFLAVFSLLQQIFKLLSSVYLFFLHCPYPGLINKFSISSCSFLWSLFLVFFPYCSTNSQIPFARLFILSTFNFHCSANNTQIPFALFFFHYFLSIFSLLQIILNFLLPVYLFSIFVLFLSSAINSRITIARLFRLSSLSFSPPSQKFSPFYCPLTWT